MQEPELFHLNIGELIVAEKPVILSTVLGSCVSVCLFSRSAEAGGMIHYALPHPPSDVSAEDQLRYGSLAIVRLIDEVSRLCHDGGASLQAKLVGGASDTNGSPSSFPVGRENIEVAIEILERYKIPLVGTSTGGRSGRKVLFHLPGGRLQVAELGRTTLSPPVLQQPKKVLIVDDSKVVRGLLTKILQEDPQLKVVAHAENPLQAEELIKSEKPDVITLDIHMPVMTGVKWLETLLPRMQIPVVMISSLEFKEGNEVFRALELGAVDYIRKPVFEEISTLGPLIREKVMAASLAKVQQVQQSSLPIHSHAKLDFQKIIAIGASTGGTEAIKNVLCRLPKEIPPLVIVQHIPPVFSTAYAKRLDELCPFKVKEAEDGDELISSRALLAPGGQQMKVISSHGRLIVRITDDPPMSRHKPSVDYLFSSMAKEVGPRGVGIILTGMGEDGARGLLEMKQRGAVTMNQSEKSCVVYGMPKAAFEMGASELQVDLNDIPHSLLKSISIGKKSA